jgi:hypothetical protein
MSANTFLNLDERIFRIHSAAASNEGSNYHLSPDYRH